MSIRIGRRSARALLALAGALLVPNVRETPVEAATPPVADVDAALRAEGNERAVAVAMGKVLFRELWPAQILHVRVDGTGRHEVAGVVISAVKFHRLLHRRSFDREVLEIIREGFAATSVEEIDLQAEAPIHVGQHIVVSGDLAMPTSRIVYAVTVRRRDLSTLEGRLSRADDIFIAPDFARRLSGNR